MDAILKDEVRTARKTYPCDAFGWWHRSGFEPKDCETDDQRLIVEAAEADKGKILPGQQYRYMRGVFEGRMVTWRERIGMGNLCRDLGLYEE